MILQKFYRGIIKGGFYSERADAFVISSNRQTQLFSCAKGQLISKANQSSRRFSQKTNENTSHSSKNESSAWQFAFEINWPLEVWFLFILDCSNRILKLF